jgi:hypothetical protein
LKSDRNSGSTANEFAKSGIGAYVRSPQPRELTLVPCPPDEDTRSTAPINLGAINAEITPTDLDSDLPRKEVIQPHLPVRLPCYDFVPITDPTFDGCLLAVGPPASGVADFHDVTGGVYKAREHIHRRMLTGGY